MELDQDQITLLNKGNTSQKDYQFKIINMEISIICYRKALPIILFKTHHNKM